MNYRDALHYMSLHWREVVVSQREQQRKVCKEQRLEAQRQFEARRAEALAREEAKRAEQLLEESQAKLKKFEVNVATAIEQSQLGEPVFWGSWRVFLAFLFLLLGFWEFVLRRLGRLLVSFLRPARNHALLTEASLRRQVDEQDKKVSELKEDVDATKQLCRSQEEMLHAVMRHPLMAAADCDQGTRHSSEPIAMQQSDTCSEVWSHTSWLEISEREELVTNSLSKISAGGTDSPEPCCYLQESLFLAEDKGKYIPGFALYEGCKISAADGTVIRVTWQCCVFAVPTV